jgi:hypothetical protein
MAQQIVLNEHPLLGERGSESILPPSESARGRDASVRGLAWRQGLGSALIVLGVLAVIVAWIGVSGTVLIGDQLSYLASGGVGGVGLIGVGVVLLVMQEHVRDRLALEEMALAMRSLQETVADEFASLHQRLPDASRRVSGDRS